VRIHVKHFILNPADILRLKEATQGSFSVAPSSHAGAAFIKIVTIVHAVRVVLARSARRTSQGAAVDDWAPAVGFRIT
jgi:hypothetical protein